MPELPEVETTVRQLQKKVLGRKIIDIWTDNQKMLKKVIAKDRTASLSPGEFKKRTRGARIENIERRGKNIIFKLGSSQVFLIHQKLTGHLLHGKWERIEGKWRPEIRGPLEEKINRYIHLILFLDNGGMLALSDLRKFAKALFGKREEISSLPEIKKLGPEPLIKNFTFEKFKNTIEKARGKIKEVLMDQSVIAGIGNIYSDEILWQAKIHPLADVKKIKEEVLKKLYLAMKDILEKAIECQGESISDWRDIKGKEGSYDKIRKVYRRENQPCSRCKTKIKRIKVKGRSAHFCPKCQIID